MQLRDVTIEDLPIFFEHQREPAANRMASFPARERDAFMAHWQGKVLGDPANRTQTIVVDGEVAGNVVSWDLGHERAIGYWIGEAFWGRGVATEALRAFLAEHERTRPISAYVATENLGSMRVLEKCGFRRVRGLLTVGADGVEELLYRLV
jgi:RimJ/RimL family protein N-acetyltransferase